MNIIKYHNRIMKYINQLETSEKCALYVSCILNCICYNCSIRDYFLFKFYQLNHRGKKEYLSGIEQNKWYSKNNDSEMEKIFNDKESCLRFFNQIIERKWCGPNSSQEQFDDFEKTNKEAIFKPLNLCGGKGISIQRLSSFSSSLYLYCKKEGVLVEELISQHSDLGKLYPYSVNTIRMVTRNNELIAAVLRTGRNKSRVDNMSSGGIVAAIDIDTGIVFTVGYTNDGDEFIHHPDTGVIIPGFTIPKWKECKEYVKKASEMCNGVPIIGWDVAISTDGPTLVEVNARPEIELIEVPFGKGVRKLFR